jgi:hypothetical protein
LWQHFNSVFLRSIQAALPNANSNKHKQKKQLHRMWRAKLQEIGGVIRSLMTKNRAEDMVCKQDLGNWEVLEFETENFDSSLDETPRRTVVLVGESSQLIDGCEDLPNASGTSW